jgi:hypothetical protein
MRSYYHAGDIGDLIYGLAVVKALGGGELLVGTKVRSLNKPRTGIGLSQLAFISSFIRRQPYIERLHYVNHIPFALDLNAFRQYFDTPCHPVEGTKNKYPHLLELHFKYLHLPINYSPWLVAGCGESFDVIIWRTERQISTKFPWKEVLRRYSPVFIGTESEHARFQAQFGPVRYFKVQNLDHAAQLINSARLCIGNSTCFLAVALGLGKQVIQETTPTPWHSYTPSCWPNCVDVEGPDLP